MVPLLGSTLRLRCVTCVDWLKACFIPLELVAYSYEGIRERSVSMRTSEQSECELAKRA